MRGMGDDWGKKRQRKGLARRGKGAWKWADEVRDRCEGHLMTPPGTRPSVALQGAARRLELRSGGKELSM